MSDCLNAKLVGNKYYYGIYDSRAYEPMSDQEKKFYSDRLHKQYRYGVIDKNCRNSNPPCPIGYTNEGQNDFSNSFTNRMGDQWSKCFRGKHLVCGRVFSSDVDDQEKMKCCANIQNVDRTLSCNPNHCFQSEQCDGFMKSFCKFKLNGTHPKWIHEQCQCINADPKDQYYQIEDEKIYIDSACICASTGGYRLPQHRGDCAQTICILNNVQAENISQDCKAAIYRGNVIDPNDYRPGTVPDAPTTIVSPSTDNITIFIKQNKFALVSGISLVVIILSLIMGVVFMSRRKKKIKV